MRKKGHLEDYQLEALESISKKLKYLRIKNGYSNYEDFSYDADIARAQYGKYEKGANILVTTLVKILKQHNMTLEEFFSLKMNDKEGK